MQHSDDAFQAAVWAYYRAHGRHDLPWRQPGPDGRMDAYKVLVSELMLQQTQVARVVPKFAAFMRAFPTMDALAAAPLSEVLRAWSGLGYNRRAKFLWQTAGIVARQYVGILPRTSAELVRLPGIGANTAGALLVYAYDQPAVFIETNIRTVFIYHYFANQEQVSDKMIADVVARTLSDSARQWYWALMDYGTHLKQTVGNLNVLSKHYQKQSPFHGSRRQIRGIVLRLLGEGRHTDASLAALIADERLPVVLRELIGEGLIAQDGQHYKLAGA